MVYNCFIKCKVCKCITRVRLQVGHLCEHPIVITCGNCGISLNGRVKIGQEAPSLVFEFENADIVDAPDKSDYVVECSGEFPVNKPHKDFAYIDSNKYPLSPFIIATSSMELEGYQQFCKDFGTLYTFCRKWTDVKRVFELQKNGKKEYLLPEIWKILPKENFPCRNEYEILRAIHIIEIHYLMEPLQKKMLQDLSFSSDILKLFPKKDAPFLKYLSEHNGYSLDEMQTSIYKIYEEFVKVYPALIPALATRYYKSGEIDYESVGSATSTYDTVKQFSLDAYETLGNLLIIPIALNNMKYRHDFSLCCELDGKNIGIDDFLKKTKATRFHYCVESEIYTKALGIQFDSKLRNAIGHNDVEYDNLTQKLTYIPDPRDRSKKKTTYLLQFEDESLRLLQSILVIAEYLYRLRELDLIEKGVKFLRPEELDRIFKNVGPNDPCPCGSGLKFKRCHGRR